MNKLPPLNTLTFFNNASSWSYDPEVRVVLTAGPEFLTTERIMYDGEDAKITSSYADSAEFEFYARYERDFEVLVNGVTAIYVSVLSTEKPTEVKFQAFLPNMLAQQIPKAQKELKIFVQPGKVTVRAL